MTEAKARRPLGSVLIDLLLCLLLSACTVTALFTVMGVESGFWFCFAVSAADVALVFIFTRRWWLLPAALLAAAGLAFGIAWLSGGVADLLGWCGGFVGWWLASFPTAEPYSFDGSMLLVQLLTALPVAALLYGFMRRFFSLTAEAVLSGGIVLLLFLLGSEQLIYVLAVLLLTFMAALPRVPHRAARGIRGADTLSRAIMQAAALPVALFAVLLAVAVSPMEDGQWYSQALVDAVGDVEAYFDYRRGVYTLYPTYNIAYSGFQPLSDRLGGDVELDGTRVVKVSTDYPGLLKGSVCDTYTGDSWYYGGESATFRYDSLIWSSLKREVFQYGLPVGGRAALEQYGKLTRDVRCTVSPYVYTPTVFYFGTPRSVSENDSTGSVYFTRSSQLLMLNCSNAYPTVTLETTVFDPELPDFEENFQLLERIVAASRDEGWDEICGQYLQLPDTLPQSVRDRAAAVTDGLDSPYMKAAALADWLRESCVYTTTPGTPPEGDFVANFLETREGYCVYYASAMTVLARCAGLPARYVTGFALKQDGEGSRIYYASHATAHAWTEVYFYGIGWVPFDSTGWVSTYVPPPAVEPEPEPEPSPTPSALPPNLGDLEEEPEPEPVPLPTRRKKTDYGPLLYVLCSLAGLGLLLALYRVGAARAARRGMYARLCRRFPEPARRADAGWSAILRQLRLVKLRPEPGETMAAFALRVDDSRAGMAVTLFQVGQIMARQRYGLVPASDSELRLLCRYSDALERRLIKELGALRYFLRRLIV